MAMATIMKHLPQISRRKRIMGMFSFLVLCLFMLLNSGVAHAAPLLQSDPMTNIRRGPWLSGTTLLNPVAVTWGAPRLDVFLVGPDRQLYHYWQQGGSVWGLESWGGNLNPLTRISVVSWGVGRLDVFGVDDNGALQHFWQDGGSAHFQESWGNNSITGTGWSFSASPTAVSWGVGRLDVFLIGTNGSLDHFSQYDGAQPVLTPLGGQFASGTGMTAPQVVSWGMGRLDVFVAAFNGNLWHYWEDGATNTSQDAFGQENIGGNWIRFTLNTITSPVVTTWGVGRLDLFLIDNGGSLWHIWQQGGPGFGQELLATGFRQSLLSATSWGQGRLDLFVAGADHDTSLHHYWQAGGPGWNQDIPGGAGYDIPSSVSWGPGRLDVFNVFNNLDASLLHYWGNN